MCDDDKIELIEGVDDNSLAIFPYFGCGVHGFVRAKNENRLLSFKDANFKFFKKDVITIDLQRPFQQGDVLRLPADKLYFLWAFLSDKYNRNVPKMRNDFSGLLLTEAIDDYVGKQMNYWFNFSEDKDFKCFGEHGPHGEWDDLKRFFYHFYKESCPGLYDALTEANRISKKKEVINEKAWFINFIFTTRKVELRW